MIMSLNSKCAEIDMIDMYQNQRRIRTLKNLVIHQLHSSFTDSE